MFLWTNCSLSIGLTLSCIYYGGMATGDAVERVVVFHEENLFLLVCCCFLPPRLTVSRSLFFRRDARVLFFSFFYWLCIYFCNQRCCSLPPKALCHRLIVMSHDPGCQTPSDHNKSAGMDEIFHMTSAVSVVLRTSGN